MLARCAVAWWGIPIKQVVSGENKSQNTKHVEYFELFETRSFSGERLKFFRKQGGYSHSQGDGEN